MCIRDSLHGGDRRNLDGAVVKVRDVTGAAIRRDVNGAEGQPLIFGIHFIEEDVYKRQVQQIIHIHQHFLGLFVFR